MTLDTFAQLDEIRKDLVGAVDTADLVRVNLQLVAWLEAWALSAAERQARLQQLVREAYDLLQNPETGVDLRDWLRAAAPFVRSDR